MRSLGRVEWERQPQNNIGVVAVEVALQGCHGGKIRMGIKLHQPYRLTFVFLLNRVPVFRVCLHDSTTGVEGTHSHTYIPTTGREKPESLSGSFSMIPKGSRPSAGDLQAAFEEFASLVYVQLAKGYWTNP